MEYIVQVLITLSRGDLSSCTNAANHSWSPEPMKDLMHIILKLGFIEHNGT